MRKCHHHFNLHLLILHHGTQPSAEISHLGQPTEGGPGQTGAGTIWLPPFQTSKVWFGKRLAKSKKMWEISSVSHVFFSDVYFITLENQKNVMLILVVL